MSCLLDILSALEAVSCLPMSLPITEVFTFCLSCELAVTRLYSTLEKCLELGGALLRNAFCMWVGKSRSEDPLSMAFMNITKNMQLILLKLKILSISCWVLSHIGHAVQKLKNCARIFAWTNRKLDKTRLFSLSRSNTQMAFKQRRWLPGNLLDPIGNYLGALPQIAEWVWIELNFSTNWHQYGVKCHCIYCVVGSEQG